MKRILFLSLYFVFGFSFSNLGQVISSSEGAAVFREGKLNSIIVIVPYAQRKLVEEQLKEEMRDWSGKMTVSKDEYLVTKGQITTLGTDAFDAIAQVFEDKVGVISVIVAIKINGVSLNSTDHPDKFEAMSGRLRIFALRCAKMGVDEEQAKELRVLTELEREEKSLVTKKETLEESIANYEKKIEEAKKKIEENIQAQKENKEASTKQKVLIENIEKKKTSLQ
jgi:hypothetical protein